MERHHGFRTRGLSKDIAAVPEGPLFEGRFGRMFLADLIRFADPAEVHSGAPHE